jgi:hypothetical protein
MGERAEQRKQGTVTPLEVRSAVLRVLRRALDLAANDPDWRGGPAEYDYLTAEQIAEVVGLDNNWRTLEYPPPDPAVVLRQLRRLERDERVWVWEGGSRQVPAVARYRWALSVEPAGRLGGGTTVRRTR